MVNLVSKLALGTVQLGIPYGVNNQTGKPDQQEAFSILSLAEQSGIDVLDSAEAYGDSLQVIGAYKTKHPSSAFKIISKFSDGEISLEERVDRTLADLKSSQLYGYMHHRFADYRSKKFSKALKDLKQSGKVVKTGVSLYSTSELAEVVNDPEVDIIQLPFNVFDASAEKCRLMSAAAAKGKEVHVRSAFLQGLFFKESHELTGNIIGLAKPLDEFKGLMKRYDIDVNKACLNFALHQPFIHKVVIGVERAQQLKDNLSAVMSNLPGGFSDDVKKINIPDESLLSPANWKL